MSWLLAFAGFCLLVILHEFGHFAAAKAVGMRVERFSLFFPPLIARIKRGETEYAIGATPLGGYVRITGMNPNEEIPPEHAHRAYYRQAVWKRIVVIAAGPAMNVLLCLVILTALYWSVGNIHTVTTVDKLEQGSPAAAVLQKGDRILSVDGVRGATEDLSRQVAKHRCAGRQVDGCRAADPAILRVQRGEETLRLKITPVYDGELARARLGFRFGSVSDPIGPVGATGEAVSTMWSFTSRSVSTIAQLFKPEKRKELSGVVGSYETTRQAIRLGWREALFLIAVLSLSLGVINLFPFLPLDGGHIFWALAEKVRGRTIPFATMERAGFVGFALVIMLFVIGLSNDIGRLTGEGFELR